MTRVALVAVPLLAMLAGCGQSAADRLRSTRAADAAAAGLRRELAGFTPGRPTQCLPNYGRSEVRGYGDTLVYRISGNLKYRNDTSGGCDGVARHDDILVTTSPQGQLCAGDIARTLERGAGTVTGGCGLGQFVPYRRAGK